MDGQPFTSRSQYYEENVRDGESAKAIEARIATPDGGQQAAIAFLTRGRLRLVIPTRDALRIANQIADILGQNKNNTKDNK